MSNRIPAICPTCHQRGHFRLAGHQHWPPAVAAAHGLPTTIALWTCPACQTTVSEMELRPTSRTRPTSHRAWQVLAAHQAPRFVARSALTRRCEYNPVRDA